MVRELPDGSLQIVDGHLRAETTPDALVPVLVVDLDDKEADKVLATFDPLAAMAEPDEEQLAALLKGIETDSEALAAMLEQLAQDAGCEPNGEIIEDEIPEPPDEAITKPGDLSSWATTGCSCGDSSKPEDVDRLLDGATIHLVNTDPPYNVKVEPRSQQRHRRRPQFVRRDHAPPGARPGAAPREVEADAARSCGPRTGRWPTTSCRDEEFDRLLARLVRQHGPRARSRAAAFYIWGGYANCGNYPPVLKACGLYFSPGDHLGQAAPGPHAQGLHGQP